VTVSTLAIERLWLHIIAYRIWRYQRRSYEMSRLRDLVAQAAAVAPRRAASIESRARAIIAAEPDLIAEEDKSFTLHETVLEEAAGALGDLKHALAPLTNNPPSERSTPLPAVPALIDGQAGLGDLNQPMAAPSHQPGSAASTEPDGSLRTHAEVLSDIASASR
jgi:hypothetical protein